jgi:hypothetical protein
MKGSFRISVQISQMIEKFKPPFQRYIKTCLDLHVIRGLCMV